LYTQSSSYTSDSKKLQLSVMVQLTKALLILNGLKIDTHYSSVD